MTARSALILTPALRVVPDNRSQESHENSVPIRQVLVSVSDALVAQDWEAETGDAVFGEDVDWSDADWDAQQPANADAPLTARSVGVVGTVDMPFQDADLVHTSISDQDSPASHDAPVWMQAGAKQDDVEVSQNHLPDAQMNTDLQSADLAWFTQLEAEVIAGLKNSESAASFDMAETETEISYNEEVLRDLVRDLIREELQGDLGERITRNIRKLVRAEIARALAAGQFD